ncbi:hypothetical protein FF011L_27270 [Roseimaritima multifibrata]|uniref:Uncharacterized protein n=1 Tax=Roseimaritima multifibrata TaxID=1930274 RepID=A0A517MGD4_9BACT|nr:hypothetical protein FF011L_27270 [Roseimaritima multifibrata]
MVPKDLRQMAVGIVSIPPLARLTMVVLSPRDPALHPAILIVFQVDRCCNDFSKTPSPSHGSLAKWQAALPSERPSHLLA